MIFNILLGQSSSRRARLIRPLEAVTSIRNVALRSSILSQSQKQHRVSEKQCLEHIRTEAIDLHNVNLSSIESLVKVQPSTIHGAGNGIFANCDIPAGTVLATYGGTYIPPIPTVGSPEPLEEPKILAPMNEDYTFCCDGGGFIDGSTSTNIYNRDQSATSYDVVQLANHHGFELNTVPITINNFPKGLGVKTMKEGTPWYYSPEEGGVIRMPPSSSIRLKSVALVSICNISKGTELFFDYGINPPEARPEWYIPLSEEKTRNYLNQAILEAEAERINGRDVNVEEKIAAM